MFFFYFHAHETDTAKAMQKLTYIIKFTLSFPGNNLHTLPKFPGNDLTYITQPIIPILLQRPILARQNLVRQPIIQKIPGLPFITKTCQAMVYQPNWDHLDEEGGCCMLYMVKVSSSSYVSRFFPQT